MASHIVPKKTYYTIFAILMVLLAATVLVAYMNLGQTINILIALTIAIVKATLVILYFMHVRYQDKLTWVFAGAGFAWLFIMFLFLLSDYISRGWIPFSEK